MYLRGMDKQEMELLGAGGRQEGVGEEREGWGQRGCDRPGRGFLYQVEPLSPRPFYIG